jgi:hypothetical protein
MDMQNIGRLLLIIGITVAVIGGIILLLGRFLPTNAAGDLPGTIRVETGNISCVIPILASLLISVVGTIVLNIIIRFINRP